MHEGPFDKHEAEGPPIWPIDSGEDGALREDWMELAQHVANAENTIARMRSRIADTCRAADWRGRDETEPGFLMVGRRDSLSTMAEVARGTIEHGQAFLAWVQIVGSNPEALRLFDHAFLGSWESAAAFAHQVLGELGPLSADASEEDRQMQMLYLANELADELQRRGVICAVPNPSAGVWVFRTTHSERIDATTEDQKGGEDA